MAIGPCAECGGQVSSEAENCPHCGAPTTRRAQEIKKTKTTEAITGFGGLVIAGVILYYFWPLLSPLFLPFLRDIGIVSPTPPKPAIAAASIPTAADGLALIIANTGCKSSYSDDKKTDIFDRQYKDHLVRGTGKIVRLDKSSLGLQVNPGSLTQDVEITLRDPGAGYALQKDAIVRVTFRMLRMGGCFLAYGGDLGEVNQ